MIGQAFRHVTTESGVQPKELPGWRNTTRGISRRSLGGEAPGGRPQAQSKLQSGLS